MLEGRDVLMLYGPPWHDATRVSKHHLARYLAQRNRVFYVESSAHLLQVLARPSTALNVLSETSRTRQVGPGMWVRRFFLPIPYHSVTPLTASRSANRLGQRVVASGLRKALRTLRMDAPLVIAGLPQAVDLVPHLPRSGLVYHCADEYRAVRGFPANLPALEAELLRMADVVIVTAEALLDERRALNPRTHWIPNGVDVQHFSRARSTEIAAVKELERLPRPRVGFVGAMAEWVDDGLIADLAKTLPGWSFVLIGPGGERLRSLASRRNVHVLGPRPYEELPRYMKCFDVGIVPFRQTEVSAKADPIKAYEYLAAGLPVVSTDIPSLRRLRGVVDIARNTHEFVRALELAAVDQSSERVQQRTEEARRHSWETRFQHFEQVVEPVCAA
jgi:glycosyltransferase involved in cell wall biosynthesis